MIEPSTVLAEAIVRSRDGRSMMDWDGVDPKEAKALVADPERVRKAVEVLDDAGFTLHSTGPDALAFEGSPDSFKELFGVTLEYTDDEGGEEGDPLWRLEGEASERRFQPNPETRLHGALAIVLVVTPRKPLATRPYGRLSWSKSSPTLPLPRDLLLGESPHTVMPDMHPWLDRLRSLTTGETFPSYDKSAKELHRRTTESIGEWTRSQVGALRFVAPLTEDAAPVAGQRRIRAKITESAVSTDTGRFLGLLGLGVKSETSVATAADREEATFGDPELWEKPHHAELAQAVLAGAYARTEDGRLADDLQKAFVEFKQRGAFLRSGRNEGIQFPEVLEQWDVVVTNSRLAVDALERSADAFRSELGLNTAKRCIPPPPGAWWKGKHWRVPRCYADMRTDLVAWQGGRAQISRRRWARRWVTEVEPAHRAMMDWLHAARTVLELKRVYAQWEADSHAYMVASAFLAVTGDVGFVLELHESPDFADFFHSDASSDRYGLVHSGSFGTGARRALTGETLLMYRRRYSRALRDDRLLHVVASGNEDPDKKKDFPDEEAVLAGAANVLVVGGCYFGETGWTASDETHGYRVNLGAGTKAPEWTDVPNVCATTQSSGGGSVVYPVLKPGSDLTSPSWGFLWEMGSGSSLSTPIVAAVCALVWRRFPELTASRLKKLVVDSASPFTLGKFAGPRAGKTKIQSKSMLASNHGGGTVKGARRVNLAHALIVGALTLSKRYSNVAEVFEAADPPEVT